MINPFGEIDVHIRVYVRAYDGLSILVPLFSLLLLAFNFLKAIRYYIANYNWFNVHFKIQALFKFNL